MRFTDYDQPDIVKHFVTGCMIAAMFWVLSLTGCAPQGIRVDHSETPNKHCDCTERCRISAAYWKKLQTDRGVENMPFEIPDDVDVIICCCDSSFLELASPENSSVPLSAVIVEPPPHPPYQQIGGKLAVIETKTDTVFYKQISWFSEGQRYLSLAPDLEIPPAPRVSAFYNADGKTIPLVLYPVRNFQGEWRGQWMTLNEADSTAKYDLNGDGIINIIDIMHFVNYMFVWSSETPVEAVRRAVEWLFGE